MQQKKRNYQRYQTEMKFLVISKQLSKYTMLNIEHLLYWNCGNRDNLIYLVKLTYIWYMYTMKQNEEPRNAPHNSVQEMLGEKESKPVEEDTILHVNTTLLEENTAGKLSGWRTKEIISRSLKILAVKENHKLGFIKISTATLSNTLCDGWKYNLSSSSNILTNISWDRASAKYGGLNERCPLPARVFEHLVPKLGRCLGRLWQRWSLAEGSTSLHGGQTLRI